jgi:hypothetical protein
MVQTKNKRQAKSTVEFANNFNLQQKGVIMSEDKEKRIELLEDMKEILLDRVERCMRKHNRFQRKMVAGKKQAGAKIIQNLEMCGWLLPMLPILRNLVSNERQKAEIEQLGKLLDMSFDILYY